MLGRNAFVMSLAAVVLTAAVLPAAGQNPRDTVAGGPTTIGAGRVIGAVIDAVSGEPIGRAVIRLAELGAGLELVTTTDDRGRFRFETVPVGFSTLTASKITYVTTFYGSRRAGKGPGTPLAVSSGAALNVQVRLQKGAVITGTVRDEHDRPWSDIPVTLLQPRGNPGQPGALVPVGQTKTDDRGIFRMYGLAPGAYYVAAMGTDRGYEGARPLTDDDIRSLLAGSTVTAPKTSDRRQPGLAHPVGYAPVLYPGTSDLGRAQRVDVLAGEVRQAVDFQLVLMPTAVVSGTVAGPDGSSPPTRLLMVSDVQGLGFRQTTQTATTIPVRDGRFVTPPLPPGHYTLLAASISNSGAPSSAAASLFAKLEFDLSGEDIPNLAVPLAAGATLKGDLRFEGTRQPTVDELKMLTVKLTPAKHEGISPVIPSTHLRADGTFEVSGLPPGQYRLDLTTATNSSSAWTLKSAVSGGADAFDRVIEISSAAGSVATHLVATDHPTALVGRVTDQASRAVSGLTVAVCPIDRSMWTSSLRGVRSSAVASDGRYSITGLPAGEYFLAALTEIDQDDLADPSFLEVIESSGVRVKVVDGVTTTLDFKIASADGDK